MQSLALVWSPRDSSTFPRLNLITDWQKWRHVCRASWQNRKYVWMRGRHKPWCRITILYLFSNVGFFWSYNTTVNPTGAECFSIFRRARIRKAGVVVEPGSRSFLLFLKTRHNNSIILKHTTWSGSTGRYGQHPAEFSQPSSGCQGSGTSDPADQQQTKKYWSFSNHAKQFIIDFCWGVDQNSTPGPEKCRFQLN